MQKTILVLSLLFISSLCLPVRYAELQVLWSSWKDVHQKSYSVNEDLVRFSNFVENYKTIIAHNAEHTSPKLGLTIFADLTLEEYRTKLNFRPSDKQYVPEDILSVSDDTVLPTSVDWRKERAVTPVVVQGQCGSCYAISAVGVLEGMRAIKSKKLDPLSIQQITDCSNNSQCNGGDIDTSLEYTAQYGIELAVDYPYTGEDGTCNYKASKAIHINTGYIAIPNNDETAFKVGIAAMPTAMAVDASSQIWQLYTSGVISNCTLSVVDHSAVAVGYGEVKTGASSAEAYYIKNSWGTSWGDHGYVYISTNPKPNNGSGECGILSYSFYGK